MEEIEKAKSKALHLSTTSSSKFRQISDYLNPLGFEVFQLCLEIPELQSLNPEMVVLEKLSIAKSLTQLRPLLVDDTGLLVPALMGFPGALLKPILELGKLNLLKDLLSSKLVNNRIEVCFVSAMAISTGLTEFSGKGTMPGTLDFSNSDFLNDNECARIFYPEGETNSLFELKQKFGSKVFAHRYSAMDDLVQHLLNDFSESCRKQSGFFE